MPTDRLASGLAYLTTQLRDNASQAITYTRGIHSVSTRAVVGKKLLKIMESDGSFRMEWTDADFCIPAPITLNAASVIPERGDLIAITVGSESQTFEVLPFGNDPCWRWADPIGQTMIRVHAKLVQPEAYYE
jgi:hypothetical protein